MQDVANIVPNRTIGLNGRPGGTFTPDTVPTAAQVEGLITQVQSEVLNRTEVTDAQATPLMVNGVAGGPASTRAGHVVAVGAAAYVELSFYPDMPEAGTSLWERYTALLDALAGAPAPGEPAGPGVVERPPSPDWSFPASVQSGYGTSDWQRW